MLVNHECGAISGDSMADMGEAERLGVPVGLRPTVAVVINTYNDAVWLPQAIESVLAQTHAADDLIVIDDGSTDDPTEMIASYSRVRLVRQANAGLAAARNAGLACTQTDYILFLDADDRLEPLAIEAGLACFAQMPDANFVYGGHRTINADGSRRDPNRFQPVGNTPYRDLLRGNLIAMHATVLYHRRRLAAAGGFDAGLRRCEDYDLYLRMARTGRIGCHPNVIAEYRWHDRNMSHDIKAMLRTVLTVHQRQKAIAQTEPADYAAWRAGRRIWREYYASEFAAGSHRKGALRHAPSHWGTLFMMSPTWMARKITGALKRRARERLSPDMIRRLRRLVGKGGSPSLGRVDFGDFGTAVPISANFGFDRGLPIDRYYIEGFLERSKMDIRGRVLEIGDDEYSRRYGGAAVLRQDILHVHSGNPIATIVGDLTDVDLLEPDSYDCMVLTQTLHLIFDMKLALENLHAALKPGGALLLTVPGITPVDRDEWGSSWYWSLTRAAAERLVGEVFGAENVRVEAHGNVFAATAFLHGLATQEVDREKLDIVDAAYPVIVAVHARKASG